MDQRVQFIADYQRNEFDLADLARRFGISRKTAYKRISRAASKPATASTVIR
jgi:predicted DNA binding protein